MAGKVKPESRAYRSPLRADRAQQTRRKVLESARRLFVERGYAGTTVASVADLAGVSPETIYLSLGGKRGLLEGVMEITGPHDSAADDEGWWRMVVELPSAAERLDKMVEYSCRILARTRPIHAIIRGAADNEAFAGALGRKLLAERLTNQTDRIRRYLGGELRPGLSIAEAGERYCVLLSPELYHLLIVELGWTAERHERWLIELLRTELLGLGDPELVDRRSDRRPKQGRSAVSMRQPKS
jgi:AcrR family transcriptional regulator